MAITCNEELWRSGAFKMAVATMSVPLILGTTCPPSDEGRGTVLIFINETSTRVWISAEEQSEPFDIVDAGETRRSVDAPNVAGECTESTLIARTRTERKLIAECLLCAMRRCG
jgi:hypothetical protein